MYRKMHLEVERNKCGCGWDGGVKMEGGQFRKVGYIYSVIYLFSKHLCHQSCLRSCAKGLGAPSDYRLRA